MTKYAVYSMSTSDVIRDYGVVQQLRREVKKDAGADTSMDKRDARREVLAQDPKITEVVRQTQQFVGEIQSAKLTRAVNSERQLNEVMVDFWENHFSVFAGKGQTRLFLSSYDRDVIRPRALGKFRDLLGAVAKSPAMLFFLDNAQSAADSTQPTLVARNGGRGGRGGLIARRPGLAGVGRGQQLPPAARQRLENATPAEREQLMQRLQQQAKRGLNENYARELMELHTLGVDGGYTQKDVTEVARAFTGWTIQNPRMGGGFVFDAKIHDRGQKVVLGHVIKAGGRLDDGEQVLDILARHPSTARFIATKLARRFVSDTPPAALVDRMAARFRETDGDLREVMRTLLTSPEFLSPDAYRAKVKTPFEFVVSAVRATGTEVQDATPLVRAMQQLGMPLYMCQPPTGYKDTADAWVNTGALVGRMNFASSWPGTTCGGGGRSATVQAGSRHSNGLSPKRLGKPAGRFCQIVATVLNNDISDTTRDTIAKAATAEQRTALTLGSPEFQRR